MIARNVGKSTHKFINELRWGKCRWYWQILTDVNRYAQHSLHRAVTTTNDFLCSNTADLEVSQALNINLNALKAYLQFKVDKVY